MVNLLLILMVLSIPLFFFLSYLKQPLKGDIPQEMIDKANELKK